MGILKILKIQKMKFFALVASAFAVQDPCLWNLQSEEGVTVRDRMTGYAACLHREVMPTAPGDGCMRQFLKGMETCENIEATNPACQEGEPTFDPAECFTAVNQCVFSTVGGLISCWSAPPSL